MLRARTRHKVLCTSKRGEKGEGGDVLKEAARLCPSVLHLWVR